MKTALRCSLFSWLLVLCITTSAMCQLPAGDIAPDFKLQDIAGNTVRLSDYRGQIVILAIGTTWCPGCKAQLTELCKIKSFLDDNGISIIDVFIQEPPKTVSNYLKNKNLPASFRALLDNGQVHRAYRIYPIPRLLILDTSGRIVQDSLGLRGEQLTEILQPLIDQQIAAPQKNQ